MRKMIKRILLFVVITLMATQAMAMDKQTKNWIGSELMFDILNKNINDVSLNYYLSDLPAEETKPLLIAYLQKEGYSLMEADEIYYQLNAKYSNDYNVDMSRSVVICKDFPIHEQLDLHRIHATSWNNDLNDGLFGNGFEDNGVYYEMSYRTKLIFTRKGNEVSYEPSYVFDMIVTTVQEIKPLTVIYRGANIIPTTHSIYVIETKSFEVGSNWAFAFDSIKNDKYKAYTLNGVAVNHIEAWAKKNGVTIPVEYNMYLRGLLQEG
jgi:hypothetical protein